MKKSKFFSKLILGLTFCLSLPTGVFAAEGQQPQPTPEQVAYIKSMMEQQREQLEELLTDVREQTSSIGFCMQQLQQQIQNGKISCKDENKVNVLSQLQEIKTFTDNILKTLLTQADLPNIAQGIVINDAVTRYLIPTIQKNIADIKANDLDKVIQTTMQKFLKSTDMNLEKLTALLKQNKKDVSTLAQITDYIGFTWYNKAYRGFNNWYGPTIIKGSALLAATGFLAGMTGALAVDSLPSSIRDAEWFKNYVANPAMSFGKDNIVKETFTNALGEKDIKIVDAKELPFFQNLTLTLNKFQNAGVVAMGAITQIDLKSIFGYLYGSHIAEAQTKGKKKWSDIQKSLNGTDKKQRDNELDKVTFDDMTGAENLKEIGKNIANFMKYPERYERAQIEEYKGILLYGPPGTGKTLFAAALRNMINEEMQADGKGKKVQFIDAKTVLDQTPGMTVEYLFWLAQQHAPCIIFFDEIDLVGAHREKNPITTGQLLTAMDGIDSTKQVVVIGATNKPDQLDMALLRDGRFGKIIPIDYPTYEERVTFFAKEVIKRNIDINPEIIKDIAQETEGCSYNNLKRIITEAYARSMREMRTVTEQDFDMALDTEIRKIQPATNVSDSSKQITAIYQAGKAVARHILQTHKTVVKVTTNPVQFPIKVMEKFGIDTEDKAENKKLIDPKAIQKLKTGEVFTKSATIDNALMSDDQQEHEAMALLAGAAAHQLLLGKTYTSCNPQDRAHAMDVIYGLISNGEKVDDKMKDKAFEMKKAYEGKILKLLGEHKELLQKVIDKLMAQDIIDRDEWAELTK